MRILAETKGKLEALEPEPFDNEKYLQEVLAQVPELVLAGTSEDQPRSIWTIGFEVGVPSGSIDLLLMDSTGHVWIVETKLDKNPEVRKHVVGQVLAYASDVTRWTRDQLEEKSATYLADAKYQRFHHGVSPTLRGLLMASGMDKDSTDELLDTAIARLNRGDVTALIVVDEVNSVLRRLVEFVNARAAFELLALQIEVFRHQGSRLFIPTVVGITANTSAADTGGDYPALLATGPERVREAERRLDALAQQRGWTTKAVKASKRYSAGSRFLFRLYPKWDCIMFDLSPLKQNGQEEAAERLRSLVTAIAYHPQPAIQPTIPTTRLLAEWPRFVDELVPVLEAALDASKS